MAPNTTRKKRNGVEKKTKKAQGPVVFNTINITEISAILLNKLDVVLKDSATFAFSYADQDVDVNFFSDVLRANFSDEMIGELMGSTFGQGILMGYIMAASETMELQRQIDAAEEAESAAGEDY